MASRIAEAMPKAAGTEKSWLKFTTFSPAGGETVVTWSPSQPQRKLPKKGPTPRIKRLNMLWAAGADILREVFIHVDVDRGEEEGVGEAVDHVAEDDQPERVPRPRSRRC